MREKRNLAVGEIFPMFDDMGDGNFKLSLVTSRFAVMQCLNDNFGDLWKREITQNGKGCAISVYNTDIAQWVTREDVGSISHDKEFNEADLDKLVSTDAFKRAAVSWGVGQELLTCPPVIVPERLVAESKRISVTDISYSGKKITSLEIVAKDEEDVVIFQAKYDQYGHTDDQGFVFEEEPEPLPFPEDGFSEEPVTELEEELPEESARETMEEFLETVEEPAVEPTEDSQVSFIFELPDAEPAEEPLKTEEEIPEEEEAVAETQEELLETVEESVVAPTEDSQISFVFEVDEETEEELSEELSEEETIEGPKEELLEEEEPVKEPAKDPDVVIEVNGYELRKDTVLLVGCKGMTYEEALGQEKFARFLDYLPKADVQQRGEAGQQIECLRELALAQAK